MGNGASVRRIAMMPGRHASTAGREIRRDTWLPVFRCSYTLSSVWVCCFGLVVECIHWMARCSSSGRSRAPRSISLMRLEGTQSASPICCWVMFRLTRSSRSLAPRSAGVPRPTSPLRMLMSARYASRAMNRLTQRMISSLPLPSRVFLAM